MKEVMTKTMAAFKAVLKMICVLLYESNSEALWINKSIMGWVNHPAWRWYWSMSSRISENNMKIFRRLAA